MDRLKINNLLEELNDETLVYLYNELNDYDNVYILDDDFLNMFNPIDIAQKVQYGDFNIHNKYVVLNGYENFETFNYLPNSKIEELIDIIVYDDIDINDYI